jgi:hypothetical protein
MAEIRLQFSSQSDLSSDVIRVFDHSPYTHVDAVLSDDSLLGARDEEDAGVPKGVRIRPPGYAKFVATKVVTLPTTPECAAAFYAFANNQIGKPYDETAILAFVVDRDWRKPDSWYCSELIAAALEQAKYFSFPLAAPANKITPSDLLLAVSATADVSQQVNH